MDAKLRDSLEEMFVGKATHLKKEQKEKSFELLERLRDHSELHFLHSVRVAKLVEGLGKMMHAQTYQTGIYAIYHDVGKIHIPIEILNKTEGFNDDDRKIMNTHVVRGYEMLREIGMGMSAWIALTHHRFQPKFYPADEEMLNFPFPIPKFTPKTRLLADNWSSLTSIADAYDAANNRRNDRFGGEQLTGVKLQNWLKENNPSVSGIIDAAYENGILEY